MAESLGARLRQRREERQILLSTIADQTKIGLSLLEGLERGDVSRWPSGIFRRAFVKSYASAIGLDPEPVVREFLEAYPDPAEVVAVPCDGMAVAIPHETAAPPSRVRLLVGSALGSLFREDPMPLPIDSHADPAKAGAHDRSRDGAVDRSGDGVVARTPATAVDRAGEAVDDRPAEPVAASAPPPAWTPDVATAAAVCAELARVDGVAELTTALARVSDALGAAGLIIWAWDPQHQRLRPVVAHGYGAKILAHVPPLRVDERNATATAFRTGEASTVASSDAASGALAVPLVAPGGSVGVLAIEFHDGREQHETVRALATMVAAVVTLLVGDRRISPAASALRDRIA